MLPRMPRIVRDEIAAAVVVDVDVANLVPMAPELMMRQVQTQLMSRPKVLPTAVAVAEWQVARE
jgi:hypothetical protein